MKKRCCEGPRKWGPDLAQEDKKRELPSEIWELEELSKHPQLPAKGNVIQGILEK